MRFWCRYEKGSLNDRDCSSLDDHMWPGKAEFTTRSTAELGSVKPDTGSQVFPSLTLTSNFIFRTEESHLGQPFLDKDDFGLSHHSGQCQRRRLHSRFCRSQKKMGHLHKKCQTKTLCLGSVSNSNVILIFCPYGKPDLQS